MKLNTQYSGYISVINPITQEPVTGLIQTDFEITVISNQTISLDAVTISEISNGDYIWFHTATELGSRKIIINLDLNLNGMIQTLKWSGSFSVEEIDEQDIYNAIQLIVPGAGSELVRIYAKESITELPVVEADFEIWDENNLIRLHSGIDPDADGMQDFLLNPGEYIIRLRKAFWNFPINVPLTVPVGGITITLHGEQFKPSDPPSPDLCVVYGYTIGVNGERIPQALVKATLRSTKVFKDIAKIADVDDETVSDEFGYFELVLIPNSQFDISDTKYMFEISKGGFKFQSLGIVPNTPSAHFKDILISGDC